MGTNTRQINSLVPNEGGQPNDWKIPMYKHTSTKITKHSLLGAEQWTLNCICNATNIPSQCWAAKMLNQTQAHISMPHCQALNIEPIIASTFIKAIFLLKRMIQTSTTKGMKYSRIMLFSFQNHAIHHVLADCFDKSTDEAHLSEVFFGRLKCYRKSTDYSCFYGGNHEQQHYQPGRQQIKPWWKDGHINDHAKGQANC